MIDLDWMRAQNAPPWAIYLAKEIQQLQVQSQGLHARVGLPFTTPASGGIPIPDPEAQPATETDGTTSKSDAPAPPAAPPAKQGDKAQTAAPTTE